MQQSVDCGRGGHGIVEDRPDFDGLAVSGRSLSPVHGSRKSSPCSFSRDDVCQGMNFSKFDQNQYNQFGRCLMVQAGVLIHFGFSKAGYEVAPSRIPYLFQDDTTARLQGGARSGLGHWAVK